MSNAELISTVTRALASYFPNANMTDDQTEALIDALAGYGADVAVKAIIGHYQGDDHQGHPKAFRLRERAAALATGTTVGQFVPPRPTQEQIDRDAQAIMTLQALGDAERAELQAETIASVAPGFLRDYWTKANKKGIRPDWKSSPTLRAAMVKKLRAKRDNGGNAGDNR